MLVFTAVLYPALGLFLGPDRGLVISLQGEEVAGQDADTLWNQGSGSPSHLPAHSLAHSPFCVPVGCPGGPESDEADGARDQTFVPHTRHQWLH